MWIKKAAEDQKHLRWEEGFWLAQWDRMELETTSSHLKLRNILSGGWLSLLRGTWSQSQLGLCDPE